MKLIYFVIVCSIAAILCALAGRYLGLSGSLRGSWFFWFWSGAFLAYAFAKGISDRD